jgi:ubiquinone/menaquinone biosynthesis C-methylase UbiE
MKAEETAMESGTDSLMDATIDHVSAQDGYDRWSAIYDTDGNPLVALEQPLVEQLLGDIRRLQVLDLGCGTGRHAIRMAQAGAKVHAIDFSEAMLERARSKAAGLDIHFQAHDLTQRFPFADREFDRIVCALVIEHIAGIDDYFREMYRLCKPDGIAIVSAMHPAMMLKGVQARFWDPHSGRQVRPQSHPHQICDYVMAAARAGFRFEHLSEHAVDQALAERFPRGQRYVGWQILLLLVLRPDRQVMAQ